MASLMLGLMPYTRLCCQPTRNMNLIKNRLISCSAARRSEDKAKTESGEDQNNNSTDSALTVNDSKNEIAKPNEVKAWRSPRQFLRDSHYEIVSQAVTGDYCYPQNLEKIALLWGNYYETREDIPRYIGLQKVIAANDKMRVAIMYWLMSLAFFFLFTMMFLGRRRVKLYHKMISEKQNLVWAAREEAYNR